MKNIILLICFMLASSIAIGQVAPDATKEEKAIPETEQLKLSLKLKDLELAESQLQVIQLTIKDLQSQYKDLQAQAEGLQAKHKTLSADIERMVKAAFDSAGLDAEEYELDSTTWKFKKKPEKP